MLNGKRARNKAARANGTVISGAAHKTRGKHNFSTKKQSTNRFQNAFKLKGSDGDDTDASDVEVKSEDDEEIDSDEAFESGDEDRFGSFKFSGSRFLKENKIRGNRIRPRVHISSVKPHEINLNEDSDDEFDPPSMKTTSLKSGTKHATDIRASKAPTTEESQSDFEDDEGEDIMDLSEMLNPAHRETTSSSIADDSVAEDTEKDDENIDTSDEEEQNGVDSDDSDDASQTSETSQEIEHNELPDELLNRLVQQVQQKRKRSDESLPLTADTKQKKRSYHVEDNEEAPEDEHHLNLSSTQGRLDLNTMLDSLGSAQAKLLRGTQTLQAPLAKPIQDRINRSAAYDTVKEHITKWQPAVRQMREATVLKFPLNELAPPQPNNNSLAATFNPSTDLELEISSILKESGMQSEKSIAKFEDLEMAKVSVEEVKRRRAELAIMRDLMFRQEQKAKRQSKIKSKAYRRVHRKEKEKARLAMETGNSSTLENPHDLDAQRARERMELRHKNTGKWAQKMLDRADHDEGSRAAITEQLQRGEELERKIRGVDTKDNDSDSEIDVQAEPDEPLPDKGVFSMKFMRDADAREAELLKESDESDSHVGLDDNRVGGNEGRRTFKPLATTKHILKKDHTQQISGIIEKKPSNAKRPAEAVRFTASRGTNADSKTDYNPWLDGDRAIHTKRDKVITKDADDASKFAAKLKKKKSIPQHQGRINAPVLDVEKILPLRVHSPALDDENEEGDHYVRRHDPVALKQIELVSQAFAGDDVVAEFETIKDKTVSEDAPQEIDETLPGWGSWTGDGIKKSRNAKKFIKHVDGIKLNQRKDAKLQHVIINEKRMKQAKSYMSQSVPFPFENKEQYERSLNLPIGPEFTTRTNFQKQIMPHVVKKQGKVVAPMDKPFKD